MESTVKFDDPHSEDVLYAFFGVMEEALPRFTLWAFCKYSSEYGLFTERVCKSTNMNGAKEELRQYNEKNIECIELMLDSALQNDSVVKSVYNMARYRKDETFRDIELSIGNILSGNERVAIAKIREISSWVIRMINTTGLYEDELFGGVVCSPSSMRTKLVEDLLDNERDSTDNKLSFVLDMIESCRVFYSFFATKCEDYGYDLKDILLNTESLIFYIAEDYETKNTAKLTQPSIDPIDDIIIYQDAQRAKDIIKSVMNGMKNKTACVAIRALIMAEIIKSEHTIARCTIFKIISEFLETDIGTDNSIGRHWKKSEDAAKEKCNQIKKLL